jgi:hypothetical protein
LSATTAALATITSEAHHRNVPHDLGYASTAGWLRDLLRIPGVEASRLLTLGELLHERPALAGGVATGDIGPSQALQIGHVLHDLPAEQPVVTAQVEQALIGYAHQFEPALLRRVGDRVLAHVDPDLADRTLRQRLDREEKRAYQQRGFTLSADGLGGMRVFGRLDPEAAATITAAIAPLTSPVPGPEPDPRAPAARRADALVDVCRLALSTGDLPVDGGQPAQKVVTVDWDALSRDVAVGHLDTGESLSPGTTRRLACQAGILPIVMSGNRVPLDVGRSRRPFTRASRSAILIRDRGCAFPGCDRPPRWTDIHHIVFWSHGGSTNHDNGVALCSFHHHLIHRETAGWTIRMGADHRPHFIPPAHLDPDRQPRRNVYHDRR